MNCRTFWHMSYDLSSWFLCMEGLSISLMHGDPSTPWPWSSHNLIRMQCDLKTFTSWPSFDAKLNFDQCNAIQNCQEVLECYRLTTVLGNNLKIIWSPLVRSKTPSWMRLVWPCLDLTFRELLTCYHLNRHCTDERCPPDCTGSPGRSSWWSRAPRRPCSAGGRWGRSLWCSLWGPEQQEVNNVVY